MSGSSSVSIEVPGAARCPAATLVTDLRAGTLRLQPDTLGRAQHLPDNMRRRRITTCGRTLQCEKCQAFEPGDGERWPGAGLAVLRRSKLAAAGLEGQQHRSLNGAPRRAWSARHGGGAATGPGGDNYALHDSQHGPLHNTSIGSSRAVSTSYDVLRTFCTLLFVRYSLSCVFRA
jgi:hypothetical protein